MAWRQWLRRWLSQSVAPVICPDLAQWCPVCSRRIPGPIASFNGNNGLLGWSPPLNDKQLIDLCPVDGELGRGRTAATRSVTELRAISRQLTKELCDIVQPSWARQFRKASMADDAEFPKLFGHTVAVLIRRGPSVDLSYSKDDLEQLLFDVVSAWAPERDNRFDW